ncbi:MAG: histidine phosphatase family protein [Sulfuritalea sp.]|nr:histidine phosphatase family protein [Sulfuritalea sp.]
MSQPTYVCVARHGETDWNIAGILQGWTDVPINDQGRRQAYELVGGFSHAGFAKVYSSPLIRSRETAEIIARSLRLEQPTCHDGLMERNFGAIQGIPKSELADLNPVLLQQILKRNPAIDFEQGESMDEFADRVIAAVASIARPNAGRRILAITHGWVMDVITRHIAGLPRTAILNMKRRNGECVWLEVRGESIRPL